jgi:hypothetical protein
LTSTWILGDSRGESKNAFLMFPPCNAAGESSGHSIMSTTSLRKDPFAPSAKDGVDERLAIKDAEIEQLVQERERCSNELQRIKDILGFSDTPDEYKKRSSYLPDQVRARAHTHTHTHTGCIQWMIFAWIEAQYIVPEIEISISLYLLKSLPRDWNLYIPGRWHLLNIVGRPWCIQGPLYETARQLQTAIKSKILDKRKSIARMSMGLPISEDGSAPGDAATLAAEREQVKSSIDGTSHP